MYIRNSRNKVFICISLLVSMFLTIGQFSFTTALGIDSGVKEIRYNKASYKEMKIKGTAGKDYAPGQLIVKFKSTANISSANKLAKAKVLKTQKDKKVQLVKIDNQADFLKTIETYRNNPDVEYVQPNYKVKTYFTPNDSMYNLQWALTEIQVPPAWDITQAASDVTVAIVDTGVDLDHPDLAANIVTGTDIIDANTPPEDEDGHGTHVAGIVAAVTNNSKGVSGIASGAKIMPIRVLGPNGGYSFDIYYGIKWAVDHGANIINLSLGMASSDVILEEAVNDAHDKGVIVVAAAGNENSSISYPAAYDHVIAVGATDENDQRASFSNHGPQIDVAAPGVDILSTTPNTFVDPNLYLNYDYMSGTSMASPMVAGLAALILSKNHNLTPDQVENIIKQSADDLGTPGFDNYFGYGRINAYKALAFNTFKINNGAATTNSPNVTLNIDGPEISGNIIEMQFSNDSSIWSPWEPYSTTYSWKLTSGDGIKKVYAKFKDSNGNEFLPMLETIKLDTTKPITKMVAPLYTSSVSLSTTFNVSWSANDQVTSSGIKSYDIDYREGGTTNWITWRSGVTERNSNFWGKGGKTYYFRARARDVAGNLGNWTTSIYKTIVPYDNNSLIAARNGFYYTYNNIHSYNYLGTYRYSNKANEQITYKFIGDRVALIGLKGNSQSKGKIYIDNVYKGIVDEYSSTAKYRQVIYSTYWKTKGTHTIKIVNLGTIGRRNFNIDGIAVGN